MKVVFCDTKRDLRVLPQRLTLPRHGYGLLSLNAASNFRSCCLLKVWFSQTQGSISSVELILIPVNGRTVILKT